MNNISPREHEIPDAAVDLGVAALGQLDGFGVGAVRLEVEPRPEPAAAPFGPLVTGREGRREERKEERKGGEYEGGGPAAALDRRGILAEDWVPSAQSSGHRSSAGMMRRCMAIAVACGDGHGDGGDGHHHVSTWTWKYNCCTTVTTTTPTTTTTVTCLGRPKARCAARPGGIEKAVRCQGKAMQDIGWSNEWKGSGRDSGRESGERCGEDSGERQWTDRVQRQAIGG